MQNATVPAAWMHARAAAAWRGCNRVQCRVKSRRRHAWRLFSTRAAGRFAARASLGRLRCAPRVAAGDSGVCVAVQTANAGRGCSGRGAVRGARAFEDAGVCVCAGAMLWGALLAFGRLTLSRPRNQSSSCRAARCGPGRSGLWGVRGGDKAQGAGVRICLAGHGGELSRAELCLTLLHHAHAVSISVLLLS